MDRDVVDQDVVPWRHGPEALYVCLYLPEFPAQARVRLRPELKQAAVVILEGVAPLERVCGVSARAARLGVSHGMTSAELEGFDGLSVLRRSTSEEQAARGALLQIGAAFTPRMEICPTAGAAFALMLDMSGTTRVFGPTAAALRQIADSVQELGLTSRIAASSNFHAAVCAAPYAAKAQRIIQAGEEGAVLAMLPLDALALSEEQHAVFRLWGLHTLGELAALPETDLAVRLGQEGKRLRQLARGEHPHLFVPEEASFELAEFVELDSPIETVDSLLFVLGPMLDGLILRAKARSLALSSITLRLRLEGRSEHTRTIKPALPVAERELLLKLLHLDLQAHSPSAEVTAINLEAEPGARSKVQLGLYSPPTPEPMRLDVTLARIASLVGEDRIGRARLLDTHRSESFVMERFTVAASAPAKVEPRPSVAKRCLRPALALEVRLRDGEPGEIVVRGSRWGVQQAFGPWRRSGDWWSAEVWSREEWDLRVTAPDGDALVCVVVHDLLRKQWQMEAVYD